jgi:hypothetical protein
MHEMCNIGPADIVSEWKYLPMTNDNGPLFSEVRLLFFVFAITFPKVAK